MHSLIFRGEHNIYYIVFQEPISQDLLETPRNFESSGRVEDWSLILKDDVVYRMNEYCLKSTLGQGYN